MNFEVTLLLTLFVPVLIFQFILVVRIRRSLPAIVTAWQAKSGKTTNILLNESEQLKELDNYFFDSGHYQALKRLGFSSPLLGVAATAVLILSSSTTMSGGSGLAGMKLLFSGVLGGALLAIANQACLWHVNYTFQLQRRSATLPVESSNLFRQVDEFRNRLQLAVTDATERAGLVVAMLEKTFQVHNNSLLLRIAEMQKLNDAVQHTVDGSRDRVKELSSNICCLSHSIKELNTQLAAISTKELPSLSSTFTAVEREVVKLSTNVSTLCVATEEAKTKFAHASEKIEKSGQLVLLASGSLSTAAGELAEVSKQVATKWSEFSKDLDRVAREKLTPQLQQLITHMASQAESALRVATNVENASKSLHGALTSLSDKINTVRDVGAGVSKEVNVAMTELKTSIRSTIESHNKMLVNWRNVLDLLPTSFQSHTDGIVRGLVAQLAELHDRNHEISSRLFDILNQSDNGGKNGRPAPK